MWKQEVPYSITSFAASHIVRVYPCDDFFKTYQLLSHTFIGLFEGTE